MTRKAVIALVVAGAVGVGVFALLQGGGGVKPAAAACEEAAPACLLDIPMTDSEGHSWDREALSGKVVIVNLWATWCKPCRKEIPDLAAIHSEYQGKDVVILGVLAEYGVSRDSLLAFSKKYGINYPVIFSEPEIMDAFGNPTGLPTTFIYDRSGKLHERSLGAVHKEQLEQHINALLDR